MRNDPTFQTDVPIALAANGGSMDHRSLLGVLDGPSWTSRLKEAERFATAYARGAFLPEDIAAAEHLLRLLRYDGEVIVRRVVAEAIADARHLPNEIAILFATDVPDVAAPIIERSSSLTDENLVTLLIDYPGRHRIAIARRAQLSDVVADALCRFGDEPTVRTLLANLRANIAESTLLWLLDARSAWSGLRTAISRRNVLPIQVLDRLLGLAPGQRTADPLGPRRAGGAG